MSYKLLLVDDHPETLNIIRRVLEQQGFQVIATQSGREALTLAETQHPDLILLDVMMPEMDGREVCQRIRANPELADTPVIMFTALDEADQKLAGFDAGADDYLTKPTEPVELIERVKSLLESRGKKMSANAEQATPAASHKEEKPFLGTMALPDEGRVIMLLGVRGGAGTTTAAINLALLIAQMGLSTTLVDMDWQQGHVGLYLNQKVPAGLQSLVGMPEPMMQEQLRRLAVKYNRNLQLFLAKPQVHEPMIWPSESEIDVLADLLIQPGQYVIIDGGRGLTTCTRPFIQHADHIVVCLPPERLALTSARQLLEQLKTMIFPHTTLSALLLNFSSGKTLPRQAVEAYLGFSMLANIPVPPREIAQAANKGVPLVENVPDSQITAELRQVAHKLVRVQTATE
ncbi:MAG: response regulator [Chloroflexi bacterium]|nr:MAG: response regulator [Chloroflexota bacterium]